MSSPRICNRPQMHHPVQSSITLCPPSGLLLCARLSRDCPASARFDFQRCQLPDYWSPPHPTPPHPTRQSASIQFRVHTISSHSSPMQPLAAWRQLHRLRSQRADFWICWMLLGFLCGGSAGTPCPKSAFDDKMHNYCATRGTEACCQDDCSLLAQWSSGNNE